MNEDQGLISRTSELAVLLLLLLLLLHPPLQQLDALAVSVGYWLSQSFPVAVQQAATASRRVDPINAFDRSTALVWIHALAR